ncbi:MAG TPA: IPT/TIG domain-containing protein [Pyrinomonadaceae bacterium]|nr:IPT/TIG domain-containing protein [Pyrinomonadaceae bacterium]
MPFIDLNKPGEKKKLIWAAVLGLVAIIFLWWTFIGFGSSSSSRTAARPAATPNPQRSNAGQQTEPVNDTPSQAVADASMYREIIYQPSSVEAPEAKRNIFAYYEPPVKVAPAPTIEQPSPPPPPPLLLASISPANAYARSGDFKLEVAGDKFTGDSRIYIDGQELPTTYISPQQLSTTVPASIIANPGARQVMVRTPDNRLFSTPLALNVAAPPVPNYTYVGIISPTTRVGDTALVQDKNNRSIVGVQRAWWG